jgi:hypothetical protein
MARRFTDTEPVCCAVCMRQAEGHGWCGYRGAPVAWLCDNPDCLKLGKVVFEMATKAFSQAEAFSLSDAGDSAGEYLGKIGKTDLATLTREEWLHFLKIVLTTYGEAMRGRLLSQDAPFP